ncbi:MAG: hypothetical protein MJA29_11115, partial [Candidatus Omnitrophica bacterium]|nr:hypothetical protein [Candidatus Omnitrophota bacterium]
IMKGGEIITVTSYCSVWQWLSRCLLIFFCYHLMLSGFVVQEMQQVCPGQGREATLRRVTWA